jgi:hypothetical protein
MNLLAQFDVSPYNFGYENYISTFALNFVWHGLKFRTLSVDFQYDTQWVADMSKAFAKNADHAPVELPSDLIDELTVAINEWAAQQTDLEQQFANCYRTMLERELQQKRERLAELQSEITQLEQKLSETLF